MTAKKLLPGIFFIFFITAGLSQSLPDKYLSLTAGAGVLVYYGNIGQNQNLSSLSRMKPGFNLTLEERLGKVFSVAATGLYGKLTQTETSSVPADNRNFQSTVYHGDLSLIFHTDKLLPNASVTPFLGTGIGFLGFAPYGDLRAANGEKYYYWPGGAIMNEPYSTANISTAQPLQRDFVYETKLDSLNKYAHSSILIPATIGFNMKMLDNFYASISASYYFTFTKAIDNVNMGKNDAYLYASVSFTYVFRRKEKVPENKQYSDVNFKKLDEADSDGDGVKDSRDKCPGTPKGVKVDSDGCPIDSDGDGIPDYLDKEPNSKKGAMVDANGVTLTDEMLAKKQADWDAGASERSETFNNNPTESTIEDIEKKSLENQKITGKAKVLPAEFRGADYNKDGFIQVSEINKVIDGFFSGENDYTVEKINRLIDFFFEQ